MTKLAEGTFFGPYKIVRQIGAGAMGDVYACTKENASPWVALKVLADREAKSVPGNLARYLQDARSLAAITHPNIVTVYAVEEIEGVKVIAMEYVKGLSLREFFERYVLTAQEAMPLFLQILDGVRELHGLRILHRNLTPGNLILRADEKIKILDIGAGQQSSPEYAAPEVRAGGPAGVRSDLFSLGAIFFECVTGQPLQSTANQGRENHTRFNQDCLPWVPYEMQRVLVKLTQLNPVERYGSAQEVIDDLKRILLVWPARTHKPLSPLLCHVQNRSEIKNSSEGQALSQVIFKRVMVLAVQQQFQMRENEIPRTAETEVRDELIIARETVNHCIHRLSQGQLRTSAQSVRVIDKSSHRTFFWMTSALIVMVVLLAALRLRPGEVSPVAPELKSAPISSVEEQPVGPTPPAEKLRVAYAQREDLISKFDAAEKHLHEIEEEIRKELAQSQAEAVGPTEAQIDDLQDESDQLDAKIASLETDAAQKNAEIKAQVEAQNSKYELERGKLNTKLEALRAEFKAGQNSRAPASQRKELYDEMSKTDEKLRQLSSDRESERLTKQGETSSIETDLKTQVNDLMARRSEIQAKLAELKGSMNEQQSLKEEQEGLAQDNLATLKARLDNQQKIVSELREALSKSPQ
jgi:serine/threonine protein kinase